jgi:hypothetical protein
LIVTGLICWLSWLSIPQAPQGCIRVVGDVTNISMQERSSAVCVAYKPYYFHENRISAFFTPASGQN